MVALVTGALRVCCGARLSRPLLIGWGAWLGPSPIVCLPISRVLGFSAWEKCGPNQMGCVCVCVCVRTRACACVCEYERWGGRWQAVSFLIFGLLFVFSVAPGWTCGLLTWLCLGTSNP